jgi:hypothetical protein
MSCGVVTLMSQFYMQKFDDEDLSGCLASQPRPITSKLVERDVPARQKFDDEDLSGCLASQPRPITSELVDRDVPARRKLDDEDLSGCLVQSGFLRSPKISKSSPPVEDMAVNLIETDDDTGSDWLYQN